MPGIHEEITDPRFHPALDPVDDVAGVPSDEDVADRPVAAPRDQVQRLAQLLELEPLFVNRPRSVR